MMNGDRQKPRPTISSGKPAAHDMGVMSRALPHSETGVRAVNDSDVRIMLLVSADECEDFAAFGTLPTRFERLRQSLVRSDDSFVYEEILTQLRLRAGEDKNQGPCDLVVRVVQSDDTLVVRIERFFQRPSYVQRGAKVVEHKKDMPGG